MRRKAGLLLAVVLLVFASVLVKTGYTAISCQIRDFMQTMPAGLLKTPQDLLKAPEGLLKAPEALLKTPGETAEQEAAAAQEEARKQDAARQEAARQEAIAELQKRRDKTESERKRSGDPTPRVEAVMAAADDRLCALIDDALVYEGDTVQGYRVRNIDAESVQFEKAGKVWVQKMQ